MKKDGSVEKALFISKNKPERTIAIEDEETLHKVKSEFTEALLSL